MTDFSDGFGPFGDVAWINASHQGALPRVAVSELENAVAWKRSPHHLANSKLFSEVPTKLRGALGRLIGCPADEIILGNSASYGLHLFANGLPWRAGDEVLVVKGDFPATILPWMGLAERGVTVRTVELPEGKLGPDALARAIGPRTRVFCTSWVFSFLGVKLDLPALGEVCRAGGVQFIINGSQALGTQPLDVAAGHVDALTCVGFKWLCGPYGTGFSWMRPELRETLRYNQAYWLAMQTADDLQSPQDMPRIRSGLGARQYDVFGTANFFNFVPWTAAVEHLLGIGIETIRAHNDGLVMRLIEGLDRDHWEVRSPLLASERSTILILSHRDAARNEPTFVALRNRGVYLSLRNGRLRFAPHLYNTADDIDRALAVLNAD